MNCIIKPQLPDFDKVSLHVKHPFESRYELLINRRKKVGTKNLKNPKAFIDYSKEIDNIYENLED